MTAPLLAGRRRRRPLRSAGGCVLSLLGLWLCALAIQLFWDRYDEWRFPWAYPRAGRPTLTGTWAGTLTTGGGARRGMYMDLRMVPIRAFGRGHRNVRSRARAARFEGEVRLCGGPAGEQRFALDGSNDDAAASRFYLGLSPAESVPPDGFAPSHLRGRWNGRDSLAIEADVYLRRGKSAISASDDPHTARPARIGMQRGGEAEFRALCGAVRGRQRSGPYGATTRRLRLLRRELPGLHGGSEESEGAGRRPTRGGDRVAPVVRDVVGPPILLDVARTATGGAPAPPNPVSRAPSDGVHDARARGVRYAPRRGGSGRSWRPCAAVR